MVLKRSVFLEVRRNKGIQLGEKGDSFLDTYEKNLAADRQSKICRGPDGVKEVSAIPGSDDLYDAVRIIQEEFPQESLIYAEAAEAMEIESNRREKAYKIFKEMIEILNGMNDDGAKFRNKRCAVTAETLRQVYKYLPENNEVPKWIKNNMAFINMDENFQKYAKQYIEAADFNLEDYWADLEESGDAFDFGSFTDEKRRRKSVMLAGFAEIAEEKEVEEGQLKDIEVRQGDERRSSMTAEQKAKNNQRRASMMTMVDVSKMAKTDHRQSQSGASGRRASKFANLAKNVTNMKKAF